MGQAFYEVSRKCHLTFSFDTALCKWGEFFSGNRKLYSVPSAVFQRNFQSAGSNLTLTLTLTLTLDLLNPKSIDFDRVSRTITVPSFKSFRSGVSVL